MARLKPFPAKSLPCFATALFLVASVTGALQPGAAHAQVPQCYSVECRARGYDPIGLRVGTFFAYPRLWVEGVYDDNIYVDEDDTEDDFIVVARPSLDVLNNWRGHRLHLRGFAEHNAYLDHGSEDHTNAGASVALDLEMLRSTHVHLGGAFTLQHEKRGSPEDVNGEEPTAYRVGMLEAGIDHRFNRLEIGWFGNAGRFDFDDADTGGGQINNDDRDRTSYTTGVRASYDISPGYAAVSELSYRRIDYDDAQDDAGIDRDSSEITWTLGLDMEVGRLISGSFFAGIVHRDFDQSGFSSATGITGGADLYWNPTERTTISFGVEHGFQETTTPGASAFQATSLRIGLAQEILRDFLGVVEVGAQFNDYKDIDREDELYFAEAKLRYFANRHVALEAHYRFQTRDSDVNGLDYDNNLIGLRLRTQY